MFIISVLAPVLPDQQERDLPEFVARWQSEFENKHSDHSGTRPVPADEELSVTASCLPRPTKFQPVLKLIKMSSERYFFYILTGNTLVKTSRGRAAPVFCPSQGKS